MYNKSIRVLDIELKSTLHLKSTHLQSCGMHAIVNVNMREQR